MKGGRGLFKGAKRLAGKAFRPLGMLLGAASLASAVGSGSKKAMGRAAGSLGGGLAGGALGATIGTLIFPGVGTVVGGLLGSLIGDLTGEMAGEMAGEALENGGASTPALATAGASGGGGQHFHITQRPGEDAEALARRVAGMVSKPRSGDLYDG